MSTSVGITRTGKVTGKSAASHNVIKLVVGPRYAKGCRSLLYVMARTAKVNIRQNMQAKLCETNANLT